MAQLICRNLTLGYDGKTVVEDLNFEINAGDYLCIVGENGSGKTTLMKAILNLHTVAGGSLEFGDGLHRNEIGYLPQQAAIQRDFPASVFEIVLSGCLNKIGLRPFYNEFEKERAKKSMERLGILHLSKKSFRELSGGQQQRVLLARALCATQKILLLDEPTAALDSSSTTELYNSISELHQSGITIVMISHDTTAACRYASHILHIGNPVFFGTRDAYLGTFQRNN